uniref:Transposase n=1 Tax=Ditylenchus dipsaci TaxID=166011 RepID=A0A915E2F7_9BILA
MPRVYDGAKNAVKEKLSKCGTLSFTSDIWTNQSSGFISLTAHGINNIGRENSSSYAFESLEEVTLLPVSQLLLFQTFNLTNSVEGDYRSLHILTDQKIRQPEGSTKHNPIMLNQRALMIRERD